MKKRGVDMRVALVLGAAVAITAYGCSGSSTDSSPNTGGSSGSSTTLAGSGGSGTAHAGSSGSGGSTTQAGGAGMSSGGTSSQGGASNGGAGGQVSGGSSAGGGPGEAGADTAGASDTGGSSGSGGSGGSAATCFVPYGCTADACDAASTGAAGEAAILDQTSATPGPGPLEALTDSGTADEAYTFTTSQDLVGQDEFLPQGASPRTVSLWVKSTSTGVQQTFFNYGTFANDERFGLLSVGDTDYFVGEGNDSQGTVSLAGAWHHFAVTYDGTNLALYVDGTLDVSKALDNPLDTTGSTFTIGHTVSAPGREPFDGSISDIRVYNRVLSAGEIGELGSFSGANANPQTLRGSSSGLVFWLPLFADDTKVMPNRCSP